MRITAIIIAIFSSYLAASAFSGHGSGTSKDPFQIETADHLFEVRNNLNAYYKLVDNIDLEPWMEENSPKYGWAPIGTESTPFNGTFDGNNHVIKNLRISRSNSDNVGLFGYSNTATIINTVVLNPHIEGNNNVSAILGQRYADSSYDTAGPGELNINNCYVIGGEIKGQSRVGGIIGYNYCGGNSGKMTVQRSHCSAEIKGFSKCGGICGSAEANACPGVYIHDCFSIGSIDGESMIGGILGHAETLYSWISKYDCGRPDLVCANNYVRGNISGKEDSNGIAGYAFAHYWIPGSWGSPSVNGQYKMSGNVCIADTIRGSYRICSNVDTQDNYASVETVVLQNGYIADVEDDNNNGISMGKRLLQSSGTYEGLGWNFHDVWQDMSDHNEYPAHKKQSYCPDVSIFESGSKSVLKGSSAFESGEVYALIDGNLYNTPVRDKVWEISLGNIIEGEPAIVFGIEINKLPSSIVTARAIKSQVDPVKLSGDANGDGAVDAADVVGIINYIIGKSSGSFNAKNADVNSDGQVLVDDAVSTVELIMNNQ